MTIGRPKRMVGLAACSLAVRILIAPPALAAPVGRDTPVHSSLGRLEPARAIEPAFWRQLENLFPGAGVTVLLKERVVQVRPVPGGSLRTRVDDRWLIAVVDTAGASRWLHWSLTDTPARRLSDLFAAATGTDGIERKLADGSVHESPGVPGAPAYESVRVRAFDTPSAAPPFILEVRYSITAEPFDAYEEFLFDEPVPVARSVLRVQVPPSILSPRWQRAAASYRIPSEPSRRTVLTNQGSMRQVSWELENLPPLPAEPLSPPAEDIAPLVRFSPALGESTWEAQGDRFYNERFAPVLRPSAALSAIADSASGGADGTIETVAALYDFVRLRVRPAAAGMRDIGFLMAAPEEILRGGAANERDLCALLAALLRTRGIEAFPALLRSREAGVTDTSVVGLGQFTGCALTVPVNGQTLWLDPSAGENPAGALRAARQFLPVLVARQAGSRIVRTPLLPADENRVTSWSEVRLDAGGRAMCERHEALYGESARRLRNRLRDARAGDAARDWVAGCCPQAEIEEASAGAVDSLYMPLRLTAALALPSAPSKPAGEFELSAFPCTRSPDAALLGPERRQTPVVFGFVHVERDTVLLYAPEGFEITGVPEDVAFTSSAGTLRLRYQAVPEKLLAIREFGIAEPVILPEALAEARAFFARVAMEEGRRILVTRR